MKRPSYVLGSRLQGWTRYCQIGKGKKRRKGGRGSGSKRTMQKITNDSIRKSTASKKKDQYESGDRVTLKVQTGNNNFTNFAA